MQIFRIAEVLRTEDPQALGQPCGRDSRPEGAGVEATAGGTQLLFALSLGETPAAALRLFCWSNQELEVW